MIDNAGTNGVGREIAGGVQAGYGEATGDPEARWKGEATKLRGRLEQWIGRGADALEGRLENAPPPVRDNGRKVLAEARKRPLATTAALGVLALLLARGGRRR